MRVGVLFTDNLFGESYHVMTERETIRDVLKMDRRPSGDYYTWLLNWLNQHKGIDRLWVHPDTQFSMWAMEQDFKLIPGEVNWWTPPQKDKAQHHPKGIKMYRKGEPTRYVFFPAHMDLTKGRKTDTPDWLIPSPDHLLHSVTYLEDVLGVPFLWSGGYTSRAILKDVHAKKDIIPFEVSEEWNDFHKRVVPRPLWSHKYRVNGGVTGITKGLEDYQKMYSHLLGFDKNMQYLGACINLKLPIGQPHLVDGSMYSPKIQGLWEYEILGVAHSLFNSYGCYCPLSTKQNVAGTSVIELALKSGIKLAIKRGLVWNEEQLQNRLLDDWAYLIWNARKKLQNESKYPDTLANGNAQTTLKKLYIDMIGQFCNDYGDRYYQRAWNELVVQEAIARQGWTFLKRQKELTGKIALVANDAFYLLSHESDPHKAYPSLLTYEHELRGYKSIGVAPLKHIAGSFTNLKPLELEHLVKREMGIKK